MESPDLLIERHPDKLPASGGIYFEDRGPDVICVLKVRGLGALVFRGVTMRDWHGVSIFTSDEIAFEPS